MIKTETIKKPELQMLQPKCNRLTNSSTHHPEKPTKNNQNSPTKPNTRPPISSEDITSTERLKEKQKSTKENLSDKQFPNKKRSQKKSRNRMIKSKPKYYYKKKTNGKSKM